MMTRFLATACVLVACFSGNAAHGQNVMGRQAVVPVSTPVAVDMTHEEIVVRTAYAKFAYASEQEVIGQLALEASGNPVPKEYSGWTSDQRLAAAQVGFELSDFAVGNLSDVIKRKAIDLISPPIGEMLTADTPVHSIADYGVSTTWYSLQPHWQPASVTPSEVRNATLGEVHEMEWHSQAPTTLWQHYASYAVTITFQGKSRGPYKALFIFGHDAKGNEMVMPEDATTDSMALAEVLAVRLFPESLVRSRLRTYPVVSNWLNASQKSGNACSIGQDDVCCDLARLRCGPGRADVANGISRPLPGPLPQR